MTITINPLYLHLASTIVFIVTMLWAVAPKHDYDFGLGLRALAVALCYCIYWIAYLALTR